jgi:hypothetical protein
MAHLGSPQSQNSGFSVSSWLVPINQPPLAKGGKKGFKIAFPDFVPIGALIRLSHVVAGLPNIRPRFAKNQANALCRALKRAITFRPARL